MAILDRRQRERVESESEARLPSCQRPTAIARWCWCSTARDYNRASLPNRQPCPNVQDIYIGRAVDLLGGLLIIC
eukprot:8117814-Alexandrium_andersonii.AAC.1